MEDAIPLLDFNCRDESREVDKEGAGVSAT